MAAHDGTPGRARGDEAPVVLVTGASSGIGRATALRYARRGARLALASRSTDGCKRVQRACDATDATVTRFDRIDVVVHCAAVAVFGRFDTVPADVFDRAVGINLLGTSNVARSALALLDRQGYGDLVLVGSLLGKITVPYLSAYVISKHAVTALVRILQQETRHLPHLRVHIVHPGGVDTPIYERAANYLGWVGKPPLGSLDPADVAAAVTRAVDKQRGSITVGPGSAVLGLGARLVPNAIFDAVAGPLIRAATLSTQPTGAQPGNLAASQPDREPAPG